MQPLRAGLGGQQSGAAPTRRLSSLQFPLMKQIAGLCENTRMRTICGRLHRLKVSAIKDFLPN
jgi:hypothetical protein